MRPATLLTRSSGHLAQNRKVIRIIILFLVLGSASLYLLLYLGSAVRQEMARRFQSQGLDLFTIINRHTPPQRGAGQIRPLDLEALSILDDAGDIIASLSPEWRITETLFFNNTELDVPVMGVMESFADVHRLSVEYGRFFTRYDSARAFCVVGNRLYQRLKRSPADSLIGRSALIGDMVCDIIGVLGPSPGLSEEYSADETILLPYITLAQFYQQPSLAKVTLRTNPSISFADAEEFIRRRLSDYLDDISAYEISNQRLFLSSVSRRLWISSIVLGVVGSLSFIFSAWRLIHIMSRSIPFRTPAEDEKLGQQIFFESILLGGSGVIAGTGVGLLASWIIARYFGWLQAGSVNAALAVTGCGLVLAMILGWSSANSARIARRADP